VYSQQANYQISDSDRNNILQNLMLISSMPVLYKNDFDTQNSKIFYILNKIMGKSIKISPKHT
jgi:hypothetical protein